MNLIRWVALGMSLLLGLTAAIAQGPTAQVALTLERTACFGSCPMYSVTIFDDGTVVYQGERFVDVMGEQISQIDPALVAQMVEAFADAGYFEWDEAYTEMTVSDLPSVITSVTRNGETHQITRYAGDSSAPRLLSFLENWLDLKVNTAMWTGAELSMPTYSMDAPAITLQRTPCFGFCPVYSVAVYTDGTLIYTGIANVDRMGVHELHVEDFAVESLIQRAEMSGYFGWNDAYDQMFMTDQATVITSFSTDDQFKQITRYDGDPNAPVGLVWLEESIDQLVTDATTPQA